MLELKKLCKEFENLSTVERTACLADCSLRVLGKLTTLDIPEVDPVGSLVSFILGATVADGELDEKEYLLIYPTLVHTFGADFDFASVKESFKKDKDGRKMVKQYTQNLVAVLSLVDESVVTDVIMLCLCVLSVDGKVTLKERNYLKKLLK